MANKANIYTVDSGAIPRWAKQTDFLVDKRMWSPVRVAQVEFELAEAIRRLYLGLGGWDQSCIDVTVRLDTVTPRNSLPVELQDILDGLDDKTSCYAALNEMTGRNKN